MGIALVGANSAAAATVTITNGAAGDLIVIYAYRSGSNTAPSLPAGFTNLDNGGGGGNAYRTGYKIAAGASETSGTWTNATDTVSYRLSGQAADPAWIGGLTHNFGSGTTVTYGAVTLAGANSNWMLSFAGLVSATALGTRTGYTRDTTAGSAPMVVGEHLRNPASSSQTVTATGSGAWATAQQEILAATNTATVTATTTATATVADSATKPATVTRSSTYTSTVAGAATHPATVTATTTATATTAASATHPVQVSAVTTATSTAADTATKPTTVTVTTTDTPTLAASTTKPDTTGVATTATATPTPQVTKPATVTVSTTSAATVAPAVTKPATVTVSTAATATLAASAVHSATTGVHTTTTSTVNAEVLHPAEPAQFTLGTPGTPWALAEPLPAWTLSTPVARWTVGEPMTTQYSALSVQLVTVPVQGKRAGASINPTTDNVYLAFKDGRAEPTTPDWIAGTWDTTATPGVYLAQALIGPGTSAVLTPGTYSVWVKFVDNPETPIAQVGAISIY